MEAMIFGKRNNAENVLGKCDNTRKCFGQKSDKTMRGFTEN